LPEANVAILITDEDMDSANDPEDFVTDEFIDLEQFAEEVRSSEADESLGAQVRPIGLMRGRSRGSFLGFASALADSSPRAFSPHARAPDDILPRHVTARQEHCLGVWSTVHGPRC